MIESTELAWRGRGNAFVLHTTHSKKPILSVEPDATYPGMWRINLRGRLSDMANLTRAKDAAITWALTDQNRYRETPSEAPPMHLNQLAEV
jgi:hypothetical protein